MFNGVKFQFNFAHLWLNLTNPPTPKNWGQYAGAAHVEIEVDEEGSTYLEI